jgi:hypothetical protein
MRREQRNRSRVTSGRIMENRFIPHLHSELCTYLEGGTAD